MVTLERLRQLFRYDPSTGAFVRLTDAGRWRAGTKAGGRAHYGHIRICIDRRQHSASNLAWLWMTGKWPVGIVDHEDNDHSNDRWSNLRLATRAQNQWNRRKNEKNATGFKGVFKAGNRFRAKIVANGKRYYLGYFDTAELAHSARQRAAEAHHGEFVRHA